jgi:regulator of protease activity HflC (stomatin/prohibitin superfamily)
MAEYYIFIIIGVAILFLGIWLLSGIRVMLEYERLVIFRLGKYTRTTGPGLVYIIPIIETAKKVDMRIITQDIPRQELMTRDNIPVLANTVVYFKVERPEDAVIKIENYVYAVRQYTQAALRDTMGTLELDQVLTERDQIAIDIQKSVDRETNEWGIDIKAIELKASDNLAEAAKKLSTQRGALQLRTLQTIRDIAQDPSEKIVIFMPSEITDIVEKITKKK